MTDLQAEMMTEGEYLEHFGKKGMKWGVRKAPMNPAHVSADAARFNKINTRLKSKGVENLSNDDLAKINKRNQLLSEYKKQNPDTVTKGAKAVKAALNITKTAAGIAVAGLTIAAVVNDPKVKNGALAVAQAIKSI